MKNNNPNSKATALLALGLATCVVIGLVSSTAMKLASATYVMKNSKQPTKNPVVELLEDAIDTIVPDAPADTTPPADTGNTSTDSSSETPTEAPTETPTEAPTEAPTEEETKAPETEKETEAPTKEEETKAPETEAPEKEETTDPIAVAKQNQAVVKLYKNVLTRAKLAGREPSFKKVTYRTLDRAFWGSWRYKDVEENNADYFVAEEIAKANPLVVPKATKTTALAINNSASACLLDVNKLDVITEAVKSASKEVLKDGTVKLVIVLNDEENPTPIKATDKVAASYTSAMFPVVTAAQVRNAIDDDNIESVNLVYSDCSVELVYRPTNGQIVSMKQIVKYEAAVEQGIITAKGTVTEVSDYSNFVY